MDKKEIKKAACIHHTATFTGFFAALYFLEAAKEKIPAKLMLILHIFIQGWAILKIIFDCADGRCRFSEAYEQIPTLYVKKILLAFSVVFKVGIPLILGTNKRK